ncbi:SusC/RagA family TonB-linked outer membrane protein [Thalassobellus suaedae]|uniref:SusC/RagA family TonB-linked outer membrane protein n=1 Tax=Thalassobellus suaedae TaxID=3074124 RepID=A0ABY9Y030_9FLAO|nr:SusC/RagA family TonB-linked outer membrane protein [Flavobacteriaceae bacterium HL-DH10]
MKKTITKACVLLLFSLLCLSSFAQNTSGKKNVTGTVVDVSGVPMPGVNVLEKRANNGAVTDFDGKYSVSVNSDSTLIFSFVGMETQEVVVNNQSVINIILHEDIESLGEVVVVGYGTQKREAVTGAISTINPAEVEDLPVGNLGTALAGRVLGVSVSGGQSRPGEGASLTIRQPFGNVAGQITAKDGGNTQPLYVIDGVVQIDPFTGTNDNSLFNSLDASQVESISFLRDGSAAVYGSRASQGVVLVVTKKGKKGPARFSYSGNFSVSDATYHSKMMNASQYGQAFNIMNGAYGNERNETNNDYFFSSEALDHFKTLDYNFLEDAWSTASSKRHNVSLSGGTDDATYYAGISYFEQDTNLAILDYDKWSFRAGSTFKIASGLSADFQVAGLFEERRKTFNKFGSESEDDYIQLQYRTPFLPYYIDGLPTKMRNASGSNQLEYNYAEMLRLGNLNVNKGNNVTINAKLKYDFPFVEGLSTQLSYARTESKNRAKQVGYGYTLTEFNGAGDDEESYIYYESGSGPLGDNTIRKTKTTSRGRRVLIDNDTRWREQLNFQLNYARDFGKHSLSGLFAIEKSESSFDQDRLVFEGNIPEWATGQDWEIGNRDAGNSGTSSSEAGDLGYIARLSYGFDNKYFVDVLYRSDASTKFAPENYWGNFYNVSAGWIVSKENFWSSKTVDYLKIRASAGKVGNDNIKSWLWRQGYSYQASSSNKGPAFGGNDNRTDWWKPSAIANYDAHWGSEFKTNFGVETRLLDNRMSINIEQYYNMGTDLLAPTSNTSFFTIGGTPPTVNYAEADTYGTEISIGWKDVIGKDFNYGITLLTGWSDNKIIKGDFNPESVKPWDIQEGKSTNIGTWGYDNLGMFKTYEEIDNYVSETGVTDIFGYVYDADPTQSDLKPGMLYYRDVRGEWDPETKTFAEADGVITEDDQVQLKKPAKWVPTGFSSIINLSYKNFNLNTVVGVSWGGYRTVNGTATKYMNRDRIYQNWENRPEFWSNMYDLNLNPNGTIPNLAKNNGNINNRTSDFWAVNNFAMNIRNVNLNYSFSKKILDKLKINSLRLNVVAINPFIIVNPYKDWGLGPDGNFNEFPVLKTYSLGLNVGF